MNTILKEHKKNIYKKSYRCFLWRRHPDLNRGIKVLQTSALPLGYSAIYGAGTGNRTRVSSLEGWCSTIELHPHLERKTRLELATFTLAR